MRSHPVTFFYLAASAATALGFTGTLTISNQTVAAGIDVKYLPGGFVNSDYIGPGACGDFNGDGWEDLFLLSGGQTNGPDRLYINNQNGTFTNQAASFGVTAVHRGCAIAIGDYDNDGDLDVYEPSTGTTGSAQIGQNKLYRNDGGTTFTEVALAAGVVGVAGDSFGASFGDYDRDGDLDMFATGFQSHKNRLYRNNNNGTFSDVSAAANIISTTSTVFGFATRFLDTNDDHYPELLISGDFGTSRYLRNNGNGTFTNYTVPSGTGKDENGMGGTIGDFNRDGRIDWYVTSIHSVNIPNWTGNKLYLNNGNHTFSEVSGAAGVNDGGYGWGAVAVDFNHDRWLDIAETNGAQWDPEWVNERSYLWMSNGNGTYTESSAAVGFNELGQGRGLLNFDYDLDGDQDFVIMRNNEKVQLYRNDLTGTNIHWLRVKLNTNADPGLAQHGFGSIVRVTAGGITQTAPLCGGDNLQSQSELTAHFGLGAETVVSDLAVEWNDGRITHLSNVAVDQTVTVSIQPAWTNLGGGKPGSAGAVSLSGSGTLNAGDPVTLTLANAAPNAAGLLFIGFFNLNAPLYGGVFVPTPDIQLPIPASGAGGWALPYVWPAGIPSGFPLYMQYWFPDAGVSNGAAASNGLRAITP